MTDQEPKRRKRPGDANQLAKRVVDIATGVVVAEGSHTQAERDKDAAAVSLGRRGGLKGGVARASSLTPERRKEIAQKAAKMRWAAKTEKE